MEIRVKVNNLTLDNIGSFNKKTSNEWKQNLKLIGLRRTFDKTYLLGMLLLF